MQNFRTLVNPFLEKSIQIKRKRDRKTQLISAVADGGPRSRVCARLTLLIPPSTPAEISEPYDYPFWEESNLTEERREREKKKNVNSGHLVPWQRTQAARTNRFACNAQGQCKNLLRKVLLSSTHMREQNFLPQVLSLGRP
jgi:hypothetical protein